ncbi:MAG TPA: SDR family oxidoreductase, partial [Streptosporangiaceae bacterium]|nr:SDR family oxidoreductase [Streptosporangiaceae bacterium]
MSSFDLTGRKALVTGASRGIGREIAVAFARAGADVAIAARGEDGLAETAGLIKEQGRQALPIRIDVTSQPDVAMGVDAAAAGLRGLDIVVNNAGGSSFIVPFDQLRLSGYEKVMRLNVDSVVYVCQAAAGYLKASEHGSVINVSSVAGLSAAPGHFPYSTAKHAVVGITRTLAVEWAKDGIRVNALCPGWTATALNRGLWDTP